MTEPGHVGQAAANTDRELFREPPTDWTSEGYMPKVFVTDNNKIGMQVGGLVLIRSITRWHQAAQIADTLAVRICLDCGHEWDAHSSDPGNEEYVPLGCIWPGCHCHEPRRAER